MYGSGLDNWFTGCLVVVLAAGFALGAFVFWLLPIMWEWVKPWIHAVTG